MSIYGAAKERAERLAHSTSVRFPQVSWHIIDGYEDDSTVDVQLEWTCAPDGEQEEAQAEAICGDFESFRDVEMQDSGMLDGASWVTFRVSP
ncbi:MAG: hypothetical protein OXC95_08790 [Dehalococcoidia bacterium]|nr:hypothetical protein [Dehalococcoidia bacterium]